MRVGSRTSLISLLLLFFSTTSAASRLRGKSPRTARKLNKEEGLLFTEGRKGGDRKGYDGSEEDDSSYWASPDGPVNSEHEGGTKQKGESIYDRPAMKMSKEGQGKKTANKAYSSEPETKAKGMPPPEPESYDEPPPTPSKDMSDERDDGSSKMNKRAKGASAEEPSLKEDAEPPKKGDDEDDNDSAGPKSPRNPPEQAKEPTLAPTPAPAPASSPNDQMYPNLPQVTFVMTHVGLEYTLGSDTIVPQTLDFTQLEAATVGYLEEYLELTYDGDSMVFFESVEIEASSRRVGGGTSFVDFEVSVGFQANSPMIPTNQEISMDISEAVTGTNFATYQFTLAQRLPSSNPFLTTTTVSVYVPSSTSSAGGTGRVASPQTRMSAAGIAASVGTGIATVLVGGFLFFKIRRENMDAKGNFPKGYSGGATLAGDTYESATLAATTTMHENDAQSLDTTLYNDDRSFISSAPPRSPADDGDPADDDGDLQMTEKDPIDSMSIEASTSADEDDDDDDEEEEDPDSAKPPHTGRYAAIVSRTRAFVPAFKAPPMSNSDIKNYFKTKYKCKSPRGYEAVAEPEGGPRADDGGSEEDVEIREPLGLDLPALDHKVVPAPEAEDSDEEDGPPMNSRRYECVTEDADDLLSQDEDVDEIVEDNHLGDSGSTPSDEETSVGYEEEIIEEEVQSPDSPDEDGNRASVLADPEGDYTTLENPAEVVPRPPSGEIGSMTRRRTDETKEEETESVDKSLDDVSLDM